MPPHEARGERRAAMPPGKRSASRAPTARPFRSRTPRRGLWVPVPGGPAFLLGANFFAVKQLQSVDELCARALSISATAASAANPSCRNSPAASAAPTLAEVEEIQRRLTALGYDTGGADGRVGNDTMLAVRNYQRKIGMEPADGYAGVGLLARLRQGS